MSLLEFFATVIGQGMLLAAAGFLIKTLVASSFAKQAEEFKAKLQTQADQFRNQLQIDAHRQNTMFSRLHDKRAEIIAQSYKKLAIAIRAVESQVAPFHMAGAPTQAELSVASFNALTGLAEHFTENRVWFVQSTCTKLDDVVAKLRHVHNQFNIVVLHGHEDRRGGANADEWVRVWQQVQDEVPPLRAGLERDFRNLLGVDDETAAE